MTLPVYGMNVAMNVPGCYHLDKIHADLAPALDRAKSAVDLAHWTKLLESESEIVSLGRRSIRANTNMVMTSEQRLPYVPGLVLIEGKIDLADALDIQFFSGPWSVGGFVEGFNDRIPETSDVSLVGRRYCGTDFETRPRCPHCHAVRESSFVIQSFKRIYHRGDPGVMAYGRSLHALVHVGNLANEQSSLEIEVIIVKHGTPRYEALCNEYRLDLSGNASSRAIAGHEQR